MPAQIDEMKFKETTQKQNHTKVNGIHIIDNVVAAILQGTREGFET